MTDQRKTIINRIKKCFALSRSCNEYEAAAALRKARALMDEYRISTDELLASEASESTAKSGAKYRPPAWEAKLANNVRNTFGCHIIYLSATWPDYAGRWSFVGCGPGPDIAKYAFDVLMRQAKKARRCYIKSHLKRCKVGTKARRADMFCVGWVATASSKIPALAVSEESTRSIQAFFKEHYPQTQNLSLVNRLKSNRGGKITTDYFNGCMAGEHSILDHGVSGMPAMRPLSLVNL